ncbi:cytochrome P450 2J4-like [Amphiura filiformis]|uniref:cytochrome P450 2J4-like n=1 Tax=Amphiura filiformis TaxID=82378 RepID=UPI003B20D9C9
MTFIASINIPTALLCVVTFLFLAWWLRRPKQNLPPGPWGWPLLGYLPNFTLSAYRTGLPPAQLFNSLAQKYGSVFSMYFAGKLVIVLNDFKHVKEGLHNLSISDRPTAVINKNEEGKGFGAASGETWKEQRRFTLTTLRSFGVGKRSFEENISEEVDALAKEISNLNGKPFDPCHWFSNATSNVICSVSFGKRFDYFDPSFKRLMKLLNESFQLVTGLSVFLPATKYLTSSKNVLMKNRNNIREFLVNIVNEHKQDHVLNDPRDYIDVYIDEIEQRQTLNRNSAVNYKNLPRTLGNLFAAGTETTSTTLRWAVLYMMAFPEIQDRIHQELDSVVGRNRLPKLADKTELPFTCATLFEVQRIATIAPLGVPHSCGEDTTLGPYTVPKGSIVVPNLWAVHHDPDLWPNPDEFNPERFLDENGALQEKDELIPFATGRRICPGEHLAKMELYIFFTHLLHQFTFKKPNDSPSLSLTGVSGLTYSPKPFLVEFVARD